MVPQQPRHSCGINVRTLLCELRHEVWSVLRRVRAYAQSFVED
jgi:hypothetical protein